MPRTARILDAERRLVSGLERGWEDRRVRLDGLARGLPQPDRLLEDAEQRLDGASDNLSYRIRTLMEQEGERIGSYSYKSVLERGFALVRDASGVPVKQAAALAAGDAVEIEFSDGTRNAVVDGDAPTSRPKKAPPKRKTPKRKTDDDSQGSLL